MLLLAVAIAIVAALVFGGLILRSVSEKQIGVRYCARKMLRIFFAWALSAKVFAVVLLLAIGFALIMMAPRAEVYVVETGKTYALIEQPIPVWIEGRAAPIIVYRYNLAGYPIYSTQHLWWLDPGFFVGGLWLIVIGLLLAAFWTVKAVNRAYGL